jgi:hypothetical protein
MWAMIVATSAMAQTTVTTTGGTANSVPKFSGSTTLVNSAITESSGNVGIGTSSPSQALVVNGNIASMLSSAFTDENVASIISLGVSGATGAENWALRGVYQYWNGVGNNSVGGDLDLIKSLDGNTILATKTDGTPLGNVGIGTTAPQAKLDITGSLATYTTGTEDELHLTRQINGGISFPQVAAFALGTYNTSGSCCGPQTRLDIGLKANSDGNLTADTKVMTLLSNGNVGINTTSPGAKLEVNGNVQLTNGSGASITFADGTTQSTAWTGTLCGGDYAESVDVSGDPRKYEPGDVLVLSDDSGSDVSISSQPYSTLVGGIYATKPGLVGRRQKGEKSDTAVPMAMVGIVPTKVSAENGPIRRGDLLVTSSTSGHAMKGTDPSRMLGAIVGKALGSLDSGTGVIDVLVSLQ